MTRDRVEYSRGFKRLLGDTVCLTCDASLRIDELAFSPAALYKPGGKGEYLIQRVGKAGVLLEEDFEIAD
jgi:hypothetical protein